MRNSVKLIFSMLLMVVSFSLIGQSAAKSVPSLKLKTLDGKPVDLQDYTKKGKIVVVSFWATWCSPCKKELDAIASDYYEEWQKKYNVELLAITIDDARALPKVKPLVAQKKWKYTVLSDLNNASKQTLNVNSVPHTFLIDKKGNIVYSHSGYAVGDEEELEKKIKALAK